MDRLIKILISTRLTAVLLFIFAISIGGATLIENAYDTITARVLIYNARWFEIVILLLMINFIGNIGRYQLWKKEKWSSLMFHSAFIIIIIGAAVTRYTGFEGIMPIREGEVTNMMYSSEPSLQINITDRVKTYSLVKPVYLTTITDNSFDVPVEYPSYGEIDIRYKDYQKDAVRKLNSNVDGGVDYLQLMVNGRNDLYLKDGEVKQVGEVAFAFNNNERTDAIKFFGNENGLQISSPYEILSRNMAQLSKEDRQKEMSEIGFDTLKRDTINPTSLRTLLFFEGNQIMINQFHKQAQFVVESSEKEGMGKDVLIVEVDNGKETREVALFGGAGNTPDFELFEMDGLLYRLGYGAASIELPFALKLDDFKLEKYPGSMSPSTFESYVTVVDESKGKTFPYHIYMNHVLDYEGYRFFQSSYDKDEKGTILSVNHDFWGTWITYIGYLLLALGFVWSLFNPKARFAELQGRLKKLRAKREQLLTVFLIGLFAVNPFNFKAQEQEVHIVSEDHADDFGHLLVQNNGRIQPVHTLAYNVFHKISKKDKFDFDKVGKVDAMQVFMSFPIYWQYWQDQKLIYLRGGTGVAELLGVEGKYASVNDFLKDTDRLILKDEFSEKVNESNRKPPKEQNVFDKELLKVNERLNIALMTLNGQMLNMFPIPRDENNTWVGLMDSLAYVPLSSGDHEGSDVSYARILTSYFSELKAATETNDYSGVDQTLKLIDEIQQTAADPDVLPSKKMVGLEVFYNKLNLFGHLKNTYALLAILLLIVALVDSLSVKKSKIRKFVLNILMVILLVAFLFHTFGLGLRWYLTGHAPWSNGYEALVFIAWGGLLAGFIFIKSSKLIMAATALLAFFTLMTAGHSSMDPQLTNLEPVLKSYWLVIHVAAITISYGFFGLGFILGLINMMNYLLVRKGNEKQVGINITELTYINELTLTIGIILATIGTFLGGVWANESWGRYWGWDAKETWAMVIVLVYAIVLHLRFIPGLRGRFAFNVASILAFSSVLMTFFGVNYYLSKGLHSYARGETPVFPMWAWVSIFSVFLFIILAGLKGRKFKSLM